MRITISATATISLPGTASLALLGFNGGRGKDKDREHEDEKDKYKEAIGKDKVEGKEKDTRPYEVSLVLVIVVRRLEGNVLFKVRSRTDWYTSVRLLTLSRSNAPLPTDSGTPSPPRPTWR